MFAVRFKLPDTANAEEYKELEIPLVAANPGQITIQPAPPKLGAALADLVLVALIGGGATVVAAAIKAFAQYRIAKIQGRRKSENDEADVVPPKASSTVIIIRGTLGSEQIEIVGQQVTQHEIEDAVAKVGIVQEVSLDW